METLVCSTYFLRNGSSIQIQDESVHFVDGINSVRVMIEKEATINAIAVYLSQLDAEDLARFVQMFSPNVSESLHQVEAK